MNADMNGRHRASWRNKLFRSLGAAAGLVSAGLAADVSSAAAQNGYSRPATTAPAAWQEFAKQLQARFEQRLSADDARVRHLQDLMTRRRGGSDAALSIRLRTWVLPDGKVERVEFENLDNDIAVALRALLLDGDVGAPPPEMLQPLHLRLSLRAPEQQRRER